MLPYYLVFAIFLALAVVLKLEVIDPRVHTWPQLIGYSVVLVPLLMTAYFLTLFLFTRGMRYFIARRPKLYARLSWLAGKD
jgi:hypothetical protein